jgi:hypothetical protein
VGFKKNASGSVLWYTHNPGSNVYAMSREASGPVYLAVGDYVELVVYHDKGSNLNIAHADFAIALLGT